MARQVDDDNDSYVDIETNAIPEVSKVRLYDSTIPHIVEGHPELDPFLPSFEHAIIDTISFPTYVWASSKKAIKPSWFFESDNHRLGSANMTVVVKVVESTSAVLKTAYFSSNSSAPLPIRATGNEPSD